MEFLNLEKQLDELLSPTETPTPTPKYCKTCGETSLIKLESYFKNGKRYFRNLCKICKVKNGCPEKLRLRERRAAEKRKSNRKSFKNLAQTILTDCRGTDLKKGWKNDLDKFYIQRLLSLGCQYCKTFSGRLTLDRIDNSKGHTKDNVVPACLRCNYTRGQMPYQAWLWLAPAMEQARSENRFEDWKYKHFDFSK